jgi:hypothetical protein
MNFETRFEPQAYMFYETEVVLDAARTDACYRLAFAARISRSNEGLDRTGQHGECDE